MKDNTRKAGGQHEYPFNYDMDHAALTKDAHWFMRNRKEQIRTRRAVPGESPELDALLQAAKDEGREASAFIVSRAIWGGVGVTVYPGVVFVPSTDAASVKRALAYAQARMRAFEGTGNIRLSIFTPRGSQ